MTLAWVTGQLFVFLTSAHYYATHYHRIDSELRCNSENYALVDLYKKTGKLAINCFTYPKSAQYKICKANYEYENKYLYLFLFIFHLLYYIPLPV